LHIARPQQHQKKLNPIIFTVVAAIPLTMSIPKYNIAEADAALTAMLDTADRHPGLIDRTAYTFQAILAGCNTNAIFLLWPDRWHMLCGKFRETVAALDDAVKSGGLDWTTYGVYAELAEYIQERLMDESTTNTVFTCYKNGRPYSAELTCDNEILSCVAAGHILPDRMTELYPSVAAWLDEYGLDESCLVVC
jgi:hypothetical protein